MNENTNPDEHVFQTIVLDDEASTCVFTADGRVFIDAGPLTNYLADSVVNQTLALAMEANPSPTQAAYILGQSDLTKNLIDQAKILRDMHAAQNVTDSEIEAFLNQS